ncbi:uncharacterized protein LOC130628695 [Hydractinia symbiolongicarpus]|uniref:uncharacterized protein LOC130628695 n=1 Tax=Hydractinia symbiolongicarpus TaxID=13093 RepID=UPI0025510DAA|nr:uncharacterized protein LOC130628695 [Hydractinia symbiolongicarpus]
MKKINNNILNKDTSINETLKKQDSKNREFENRIAALKDEANDLEQYGRRMMVTIKGIPRINDEDTNAIVVEISKHIMEIPLSIGDIDISHRTSKDKDASIIVKFDSRKKRDSFYNCRHELFSKKITTADLGYNDTKANIYINESLTAKNGDLYSHARKKLKNTKLYKYVSTKHASVKAKKDDSLNSKTVTLLTKEEINKLYYDSYQNQQNDQINE